MPHQPQAEAAKQRIVREANGPAACASDVPIAKTSNAHFTLFHTIILVNSYLNLNRICLILTAELFLLHLDINVNTRRHFQSGQRVYCLLGRCDDINQSLVCSLLELFSGVLVLVYRTKDGHYLFLRRERHRSAYLCSIFLYSLDDLLRGCIHQLMVIRFQCDSHYLSCHKKSRLLIRTFMENHVFLICALARTWSAPHICFSDPRRASVRQAVTVHSPVRVMRPHGARSIYKPEPLKFCTVTCRQFYNLTFAPRKTCGAHRSNLTLLRYQGHNKLHYTENPSLFQELSFQIFLFFCENIVFFLIQSTQRFFPLLHFLRYSSGSAKNLRESFDFVSSYY